MERWFNHPNIFINEKNLQNFGLKKKFLKKTVPNEFFNI